MAFAIGVRPFPTRLESAMQPTTLGINRTAATLAPDALLAMTEAADELTSFDAIDTQGAESTRLAYIKEAEAVGSVPAPQSVKGVLKTGLAKLKGGEPTVLMDKLGERLAFERSGTRLYEALIVKYKAALQAGGDPLPAVEPLQTIDGLVAESAAQALSRIRAEELEHFALIAEAIRQLGGDPTAMTPCADVTAVASMGIMQVLNDPRTTLAQCLNAILTAELTDNAGWELLIQLTEEAGEKELTEKFTVALMEEARHVDIIKTWLSALVTSASSKPQAV